MKQNITTAIEQILLRKARVLAAKRGTSVSRLLAEQLARLVGDPERDNQARSDALADLERGLRLGGRPASRDDLHDR